MDRQTDGQNYGSHDHGSIAASCSKNLERYIKCKSCQHIPRFVDKKTETSVCKKHAVEVPSFSNEYVSLQDLADKM